jgi:hypothetical protein
MIVIGVLLLGFIASAQSLEFLGNLSAGDVNGNCAMVSIWQYETIPLAQSGAGCIGGLGGGDFQIHDYGTTVKEIRAWTGGEKNGLKALYVELFNGRTGVYGNIPAYGPAAVIVLSPGETIVGTMELCGNGIGSRTGYIYFKTSKGQEFKVGDEHTPYYFQSGESFLTGFFGRHGTEIDHLGFIMMKKFNSGRMFNLNYPTIDTYNSGLSPQVYKATFCNDAPSSAQTQSAKFTKSEGERHSFENSVSFEFGMTLSVEGGLPLVAKNTIGFSWKIGASGKWTQETNSVRTQEQNFPVSIPARSRVTAQFTWFDSQVDLPYTAVMEYTFTDGSIASWPVNGIFKGTYISNVDASFHTTDLQSGEYCL